MSKSNPLLKTYKSTHKMATLWPPLIQSSFHTQVCKLMSELQLKRSKTMTQNSSTRACLEKEAKVTAHAEWVS